MLYLNNENNFQPYTDEESLELIQQDYNTIITNDADEHYKQMIMRGLK